MTTSNLPANAMRTSTPTDREIRMERVFDASIERVWRAFTDPAQVAQWWGRGNKLVIEHMEVKRGGRWRFVEENEDGLNGFEGKYREIVPLERIEESFEWDGMPGYVFINTMTFHDLGDGRTNVVTTSLFFTPEERDGVMNSGMEAGRNAAYVALDRLLAADAG